MLALATGLLTALPQPVPAHDQPTLAAHLLGPPSAAAILTPRLARPRSNCEPSVHRDWPSLPYTYIDAFYRSEVLDVTGPDLEEDSFLLNGSFALGSRVFLRASSEFGELGIDGAADIDTERYSVGLGLVTHRTEDADFGFTVSYVDANLAPIGGIGSGAGVGVSTFARGWIADDWELGVEVERRIYEFGGATVGDLRLVHYLSEDLGLVLSADAGRDSYSFGVGLRWTP